jgi:hypothetical protein
MFSSRQRHPRALIIEPDGVLDGRTCSASELASFDIPHTSLRKRRKAARLCARAQAVYPKNAIKRRLPDRRMECEIKKLTGQTIARSNSLTQDHTLRSIRVPMPSSHGSSTRLPLDTFFNG